MAYKGKYKVKNKEKYLGDPLDVIYRSLWERKVMVYLDESSRIIQWGSEEIIVPYKSPAEWVKMAKDNNLIYLFICMYTVDMVYNYPTAIPVQDFLFTEFAKYDYEVFGMN